MVNECLTFLASFLSKGVLTGRRRYSSPITLSMSWVRRDGSPFWNSSRWCCRILVSCGVTVKPPSTVSPRRASWGSEAPLMESAWYEACILNMSQGWKEMKVFWCGPRWANYIWSVCSYHKIQTSDIHIVVNIIHSRIHTSVSDCNSLRTFWWVRNQIHISVQHVS